MKFTERFLKDDLVGVHFAVNVFIATTILWLGLRLAESGSAFDPSAWRGYVETAGYCHDELIW